MEPLRQLSQRLFTTTYAAQNTPENMALYCRNAFSEKNFTEDFSRETIQYLLATETQQIVGYAKLILGKSGSSELARNEAELARFYVDVPFQGTGLATAFMAYCQQWMRQQGYRSMRLGVWPQNARAVRFYQKEGFKKIGTAIFLLGTDPQTDDIMQKIL